jgi:hypothetical protein
MRRDQRWARPSGTLFAISVLSIGMAAVLPLSIRLDFAGGVQRLLLTLLFTWLIVVALHLMHSRLEGDKSQPNTREWSRRAAERAAGARLIRKRCNLSRNRCGH